MDAIAGDEPEQEGLSWYQRVAKSVTGTAKSYKQKFLTSYGPQLADFMIEKKITLGQFMSNFTTNVFAFKDYLATYWSEDAAESDPAAAE